MSYRSDLNVSDGGPSIPKLTLKTNSLQIKRKAQNFASWMLSEYALKIGRKKGNDFLIIVPLYLLLPPIAALSIHQKFHSFSTKYFNKISFLSGCFAFEDHPEVSGNKAT